MKIVVGSTNPIKIAAVRDIIREYQLAELPERQRESGDAVPHEVLGFDAESGVGHQPKGLTEIVQGARARARHAVLSPAGDGLGVGIESGLIEVDVGDGKGRIYDVGSGDFDLNVCACVIQLGAHHCSLGLSGAWMVPELIMKHVRDDGLGLNGAAKAAGYTTDDNLKQGSGLIGLLTSGKIKRQDYVGQAIEMALVDAWPQIKEGLR